MQKYYYYYYYCTGLWTSPISLMNPHCFTLSKYVENNTTRVQYIDDGRTCAFSTRVAPCSFAAEVYFPASRKPPRRLTVAAQSCSTRTEYIWKSSARSQKLPTGRVKNRGGHWIDRIGRRGGSVSLITKRPYADTNGFAWNSEHGSLPVVGLFKTIPSNDRTSEPSELNGYPQTRQTLFVTTRSFVPVKHNITECTRNAVKKGKARLWHAYDFISIDLDREELYWKTSSLGGVGHRVDSLKRDGCGLFGDCADRVQTYTEGVGIEGIRWVRLFEWYWKMKRKSLLIRLRCPSIVRETGYSFLYHTCFLAVNVFGKRFSVFFAYSCSPRLSHAGDFVSSFDDRF